MRKLYILILSLLLTLSFVGCNTDSLSEYKKAVEKTEEVTKGQSSGEFNVLMEFNTDGMSSEEIRKINYFKETKGSFNISFDDETEKAIFKYYLNFGGLGFDFDMYINGDEIFMKLPILGKYMNINEVQNSTNSEQNFDVEQELISGESIENITEKWLGLMKKDDVFKGKDIVITTPDGEVKTKEYNIKLNDEQIKTLVVDVLDILSKDIKLKQFYEKSIKNNAEVLDEKTYEEIFSSIKENINKFKVDSFNYTAFVDIDGYIINEIFEMNLNVVNPEKEGLVSADYKLELNNWDLNKEQNFNFPIFNDDNTLNINDMEDMEDMESNMPFIIEDMFKNNN